MILLPEYNSVAANHAIAEYPREACGVVVAGQYVPVPNISDSPCDDFQMPADAWLNYGGVQAVIHSHCAPDHFHAPSAADMARQAETALPWGLIYTDGKSASEPLWWPEPLDAPLSGRQFLPGVTDCWSLIRGWFWQNRQIVIRDFPRDVDWWDRGGDLYTQGLPIAGFRQIGRDESGAIGDLALLQIRSPVPNHSAVIVEPGVMLHHLQGRLSCCEPIPRWGKLIVSWWRFTP